jgi:hypothetical protein
VTTNSHTKAALADRAAENRELRREAARAARLIESGRAGEALSLLRHISRDFKENRDLRVGDVIVAGDAEIRINAIEHDGGFVTANPGTGDEIGGFAWDFTHIRREEQQ